MIHPLEAQSDLLVIKFRLICKDILNFLSLLPSYPQKRDTSLRYKHLSDPRVLLKQCALLRVDKPETEFAGVTVHNILFLSMSVLNLFFPFPFYFPNASLFILPFPSVHCLFLKMANRLLTSASAHKIFKYICSDALQMNPFARPFTLECPTSIARKYGVSGQLAQDILSSEIFHAVFPGRLFVILFIYFSFKCLCFWRLFQEVIAYACILQHP